MDFTPSRIEEKALASPADIVPYLQDSDPSITWVDVQGLGDAQVLDELKQVFDIDPLALADVVNVPQRSKVEIYDRYLFVITRMSLPGSNGDLHTEQVSMFIGKQFVLTFQETYGDCLDPVRERIRKGSGLIRKSGADYLAYAIIDAICRRLLPHRGAPRRADRGRRGPRGPQPAPHVLREIYDLKRGLLEVRRGIWPQRDAVNALLHDESGLIGKTVRLYLRDCYDHAVQVLEMVESQRELTAALLDVYLSSMANRTNEVMKSSRS